MNKKTKEYMYVCTNNHTEYPQIVCVSSVKVVYSSDDQTRLVNIDLHHNLCKNGKEQCYPDFSAILFFVMTQLDYYFYS